MPSDGDRAVRAQAFDRFMGERFEVPVDPMLRLQGYRDPARIRPRVRDIAAQIADLAGTLIAPETCYRRMGIRTGTADSLVLDDGTVFHSTHFTKVLAGCTEVIVFVLTLGPGLDGEVERRAANEEILEALFLETAGWIAVERATKHFAQFLSARLRPETLQLTRRLGPGYVDWPLEEQANLFAVLRDAPLKVQLMDSCAMLPKKSRSGLYGLRPSA